MPAKTKEQLQAQVDLDARLKAERDASDDAYSIKIVEKIVFGFLAIAATAIVGALIELAFKHIK